MLKRSRSSLGLLMQLCVFPVRQALMYPLLVACKSMSSSRKQAAQAVVDNVRNHSATLVKQVRARSSPAFCYRLSLCQVDSGCKVCC